MSRHRGPSGPAVSLFPFLAVLLCTMGALLVVLVIFSRSAAEGASRAEQAASEELEAARESLRGRIVELEQLERLAREQLSQARLRLAGIEDHARGLQDELSEVKNSLEGLAAGANAPKDDTHDDELRTRLAEAEAAVEAAKADAGTKTAAYAVVPYEGSSGTRRRPLYIECCGDGVFLQPEGIRLKPSDFEGPPGPGNPLASALRAAREHLATRPGAAGTTEAQPYPLLLVRPSGVMAYYAAREAIGSWGSDFGYQLVDEDWQLAFPAADPALADVEQRAIDEARARLQWLAEVRPKRPTKAAPKYRASTTRGGVVSTEGPSVLGDQSRFDWNDEDADRMAAGSTGRPGSGFGGGGGDRGGGPVATAPLDRAHADRIVVGGGAGRFGSGGGVDPLGGPIGGSGVGNRGSDQADGHPDGRVGQPSGSAFPAGSGTRSSAEGSPPGAPNATSTSDEAAGGPTGLASGRTGSGDVAEGRSGSPGGSSPDGDNVPASATATTGPGGGPTTGVAMPGLLQPQAGAAAPSAAAAGSSSSASVSLAQSRGSNWASLASRDRPIPLNRPIQIECAAGEFRLYDDAGRRIVKRIPIDGMTATAVDPLVKAVHDRVGTWGLAGDRMYWKPQLFLSETPDGAGRRADLERLLADSGIETLRRGSTVLPLPDVTRSSAAAVRQAAHVEEGTTR